MDSHESMPSLQLSDDCKTSEDLEAVVGVPPKCNGMGDSDKNATTEVDALSAGTEMPSVGDDLNDSDSALNAIDTFLGEKDVSSNGHEVEEDNVSPLVCEPETASALDSEASNVGEAVSVGAGNSEHSSDSSSNTGGAVHIPDNAAPSHGEESSTQLPQDESDEPETTQDKVCLEEEKPVPIEKENDETDAETEHLPTEQNDETDAEPVYASEAMRAFHSVVTEPVLDAVTLQCGSQEPASQMDVEMETEASFIDVNNEDHITEHAGDEEDMDVTEPATPSEDVAKQLTEVEAMEVEEPEQSGIVGE